MTAGCQRVGPAGGAGTARWGRAPCYSRGCTLGSIQVDQQDVFPSTDAEGPPQLIKLLIAYGTSGLLLPRAAERGRSVSQHSFQQGFGGALPQCLESQGRDERRCRLSRSRAGLTADVDRARLSSEVNNAFVNARMPSFLNLHLKTSVCSSMPQFSTVL